MQSEYPAIGRETSSRDRKQYLMALGGTILGLALALGLGMRLTAGQRGSGRAVNAQHQAAVASTLPAATGAGQNAVAYIVGSTSQAEGLWSVGVAWPTRVMIAGSAAEETQAQQRLAHERTWRVMNGMQPLQIVDLRTPSE